jgi:hypothetical protein
MAITLSVVLTDSEQAVMEAVATKVAPGATAAQKKAWAEKQAKNGLRQAVLNQRAIFDESEAIASRIQREQDANTGFPLVP